MKQISINPKAAEAKLIRFIKNEFGKRGFRKAVLGLSGGVDSALVAFLLKKALGPNSVIAIFLPYKTTDEKSGKNFKKVVRMLGIKYRVISITPMIDAFLKHFGRIDKMRLGNKMARERMAILYDQSRLEGALVVGSGNRTETLLGYSTIFGDTACAVNPIGCLYKTQVRQLARHIGVPEHIVRQVPTADLWPGQTDEKELGLSYDEIDGILYLAIDKGYKASRLIKEGFSVADIKKILDRVKKFKFKRELPAIATL